VERYARNANKRQSVLLALTAFLSCICIKIVCKTTCKRFYY
jgi:hypothetical protein